MQSNNPKTSLILLISIIISTILFPILFISLVTSDIKLQKNDQVINLEIIKENIRPIAKVELAQLVSEGSSEVGKSGEEVYKAVCLMCHQAGLLNAPKFGDTQVWAPRILQGYDVLVQHAIKGIRSMPAKGGNAALSDAEVASAVLYMTNSSGANFKK